VLRRHVARPKPDGAGPGCPCGTGPAAPSRITWLPARPAGNLAGLAPPPPHPHMNLSRTAGRPGD